MLFVLCSAAYAGVTVGVAKRKKRKSGNIFYLFENVFIFSFLFLALGPVHTPHPPPARAGAGRESHVPRQYGPRIQKRGVFLPHVIPDLGPRAGSRPHWYCLGCLWEALGRDSERCNSNVTRDDRSNG